jgi:hypothetical protein
MRYLLMVDFDASTPELTPNPLELAETVRQALNAEYGELGYRTTTPFEEPHAPRLRSESRRAAGIVDDRVDPPWGEQQSQVDWLESRFDEPMGGSWQDDEGRYC